MKVREIMTADVASAAPDTTLEEIATMMKEADAGAIPVVDDNALIGIVTDRDIVLRCVAEGKDPAECTAEDIVSENLETVEPDDENLMMHNGLMAEIHQADDDRRHIQSHLMAAQMNETAAMNWGTWGGWGAWGPMGWY